MNKRMFLIIVSGVFLFPAYMILAQDKDDFSLQIEGQEQNRAEDFFENVETEFVPPPFQFIEDNSLTGYYGFGLDNVEGAYKRLNNRHKQVLPYTPLREADVTWEKRIWREIDVRLSQNYPFAFPQQSFAQVLFDIIKKHPQDALFYMEDNFKTAVTYESLVEKMNIIDTVQLINPETLCSVEQKVENDFDWTKIKKYRLKEDWIFDSQQSRMVVRILGIAPLLDVYDEHGNYLGEEALFWAYYPGIRDYLVEYPVPVYTDSEYFVTWEDVLEMRWFDSRITKTPNMQNLAIKEYTENKEEALIEGKRIEEEMFLKEQNLWAY